MVYLNSEGNKDEHKRECNILGCPLQSQIIPICGMLGLGDPTINYTNPFLTAEDANNGGGSGLNVRHGVPLNLQFFWK